MDTYMRILCCSICVYACHGLRVAKPDPLCDFNDQAWGLFIDGKDAANGQLAYGSGFSRAMSRAFANMRASLYEEISLESLLHLHIKACPTNEPFRNGEKVMHELQKCFAQADDQTLKNGILKDLPTEVVDVHLFPSGGIDWMGVRSDLDTETVKAILTDVIDTYNMGIRNTSTHHADDRFILLARFLRSVAWIHPFTDCNGRTRVLLMQKELRRLGLACGAMMFNNNADIYFSTTDTYVDKLKEGMQMADRVLESYKKPWNEKEVATHVSNFPIPQSLEACRADFSREFKDITLKQGNTQFSPID